ncbi:MAG: hypothetical protein ACRD24_03860 [Terriglobales bacterium]
MEVGEPEAGKFDNRWMVFPQDFPSASFLTSHGIQRVLLAQESYAPVPREDLAHVLLRWQEGGIEILLKRLDRPDAPARIEVARPSRFRALWHRALAIVGLRRSSAGGFGCTVPESSSAG